jgi:hypothetical protein
VGSGYTVEGQVTSEEKFGGFQIEVTPAYQKLGTKTFWYEDRTGKCINIEEAHTPRNHGLKEGNVVFMTPMPRKFYRAPRLREFLGPEEAPEGIARLNLKVSGSSVSSVAGQD